MEEEVPSKSKWFWWAIAGGTLGLILVLNRKRVVDSLKEVQLSENFSLSEFVKTGTGIENIPSETAIENLRELVRNVLQPLRTYVKTPITISSGYRSPLVNAAVGGAESSQHVSGEAADIIVPGLSNQQILRAIQILRLPFDQLIDEQLKGKTWVHVSFKQNGRRQMLTARDGPNGTTVYNAIT